MNIQISDDISHIPLQNLYDMARKEGLGSELFNGSTKINLITLKLMHRVCMIMAERMLAEDKARKAEEKQ